MSEITPKNYNGLMEAYASIYSQPEQIIQEQVEEEICFEDLEVDNDLVVDLVVERLIVEGYANTEDQALNMIPHMSDAWLDNVVGNFVLEESFVDVVNSLLEEGYDLSSYTVDELYEEYVGHFNNYLNEDHSMDLHEALPLLAAPLLANPATWAAAAGLGAGAVYAGKKALDAYRQMRSGTSAEGERWLQQGVLQARTRKQAQDQRRLQQGKERVLQRQQQKAAQQPAQQPTQPAAQKPASKPGSSSPTPPGGGKGPNWKDILLGKTKAGLGTRAAGALSAADLAGTAYDPSKYSASIGLAGIAPGALSLPLQGAAGLERFGKGFRQGAPLVGRGAYEQGQRTGLGQASRGTGEALGQLSQSMLTQPWRKPSTQPAQPAQPSSTSTGGSQGMTPIIKNGQIVGYK